MANSTNPASTSAGTCTTGATTTGTSTDPDNSSVTYGAYTLINDGWPKPSWQTGVTGIPNDQVRDIPDVSFFASDGYLLLERLLGLRLR